MSAHAAQHRTPQERGPLPPTPPRPTVVVTPPVEAAMHPHVYRIALGCWACFLAVFWATFWVSSNALFQVVIATVYAVMFFGVPYEMSRIVPSAQAGSVDVLVCSPLARRCRWAPPGSRCSARIVR